MKKDLTELILVVDRSSSMGDVRSTTISGLKEFLNTQKQLPGEALLTYITFSSDYTIELAGKNVKDVSDTIFDSYVPSGMTALLDAIGVSIDSVGKRLASTNEDERPEKVMVIILTDGEENSSKEYSAKSIKEKVKHQEENYKWEFLFLGAGIDAIAGGKSMNMTKSVNLNKAQMRGNMSKTTLYSASYRTSNLGVVGNDFQTRSVDMFDLSDGDVQKELQTLTTKK